MTRAQTFLEWLYGPDGGDSTQRPHLIVAWPNGLSDNDGALFWEVVTRAWSGFDAIAHEDFADLFERFATSTPRSDLPASLTVYRGQDADAPKGLSWTLERKVAAEFARGHRNI